VRKIRERRVKSDGSPSTVRPTSGVI
jgi:hypothetical protein